MHVPHHHHEEEAPLTPEQQALLERENAEARRHAMPDPVDSQLSSLMKNPESVVAGADLVAKVDPVHPLADEADHLRDLSEDERKRI